MANPPNAVSSTPSCAAVKVAANVVPAVGRFSQESSTRTLDEAYKVAQMGGHRLSPLSAFYLATLGSARSLYLDDRIGNFALQIRNRGLNHCR